MADTLKHKITFQETGGLTWLDLALGIPTFTSTTPGMVPASGGGTFAFLRADGAWSAPTVAASGIIVGSSTILGGTSGNYGFNNAGVYGEKTAAQVTADLAVFTSSLKGLTPASGGGTTNFLRADGTWAPTTGATATPGSVIFAGPTGAYSENNAALFWDNTALNLKVKGTVSPTPTSGSGQPGLVVTQVGPSTYINPVNTEFFYNSIYISNDGVQVSPSNLSTYGLRVIDVLGPNEAGSKVGIEGQVYRPNDLATLPNPVGDTIGIRGIVHLSGTYSPTGNPPDGGGYAGDFTVQADATASNYGTISGCELAVVTLTGSSMLNRFGCDVVGFGPVQGSQRDAAIEIGGGDGGVAGSGWGMGIMFSSLHGSPFDTNCTLIGTDSTPHTVQRGIDLSNYTFTQWVFHGGTFGVTGSGQVQCPQIAMGTQGQTYAYSAGSLNYTPSFQNVGGGEFGRWTNDANPAMLFLAKVHGTSPVTLNNVISGDKLGYIGFDGWDGANFQDGAFISATVTGTVSAGNVPAYLSLGTTTSGATPVERLRIDGNGPVAAPLNAIPAGGSITASYRATSATGFGVYFGSGAPTVSAAQGSLYLRSDGVAGTLLYSNVNGATTWTAAGGGGGGGTPGGFSNDVQYNLSGAFAGDSGFTYNGSGTISLGNATNSGVVKLQGSTSGLVNVTVPVAPTPWTLTLPSTAGTANQFLQTNGSGVCTWATPAATIGTSTITGGTSGNYLYDNAGVFGEKTPTQVTADINVFTSTLKGLAPASGGGTTNFLRADGTWAAPPGGAGGITIGTTTITGGTTGNFEYNNAGVMGERTPAQATAALTLFSTATTAQGLVPGSNGAAATSFLNATGAWSVPAGGGGLPLVGTGATVTANAPLLDLSQTWNASGVTFQLIRSNITNTGSASGSKMLDLQLGGNSFFVVTTGDLIAGPNVLTIAPGNTTTFTATNGMSLAPAGTLYLSPGSAIQISNSTTVPLSFEGVHQLYRDSDNKGLALRVGTSAQGYRVYNTFTDASNYERGVFDWTTTANTLTIGMQQAGTGAVRSIRVVAGNAVRNFGVAPATKTTTYTVVDGDQWLTFNGGASITVTLPAAASYTGRELTLKTIAAFTVISASSNVVPIGTATAGTAILPATAGKFVTLVSDGTNWITVQGN